MKKSEKLYVCVDPKRISDPVGRIGFDVYPNEVSAQESADLIMQREHMPVLVMTLKEYVKNVYEMGILKGSSEAEKTAAEEAAGSDL